MQPRIGIVLVNYNGERILNACLETIFAMNYSNFVTVIVDNNSSDNSIPLVRESFEDLIIIETGENCGVAKGNNVGIKKALELGAEYVLLLNNDTEVDKDLLYHLIKNADKDIMVTPKMYYYSPNNMIWCAGGEINWKKATTIHYGENQKDIGQFDESKFVDYTPTCCLLIHKSVFDKVGFMDEDYFMYYDDTDFIVRCHQAGIKIWYEPKAKLWHKVSSSSGGKLSRIGVYYGDRNRLYFINKFYNNKLKVKLYFYITRFIKLFKYFFTDKTLFLVTIKAMKDANKRMYRQEL